MELRDYLFLLYRWFWLLILGAVICGLSGYLLLRSDIEASKYRTSATMIIGNELLSTDLDVDTTELIQATAVELAKRSRISEAVVERLSLPMSANELRKRFSVNALPGTRLIEIVVDDANPERAAAIANAVSMELETLATVTSDSTLAAASLSTRALYTTTVAEIPTGTRLASTVGVPIAALLGLILTIGLILLFEYIEDAPIIEQGWKREQEGSLG